ncbi:LiaF transmembrane domain-containing protein [Rubrolithibacter danxiaensis]|uniref:LiaF transmembrane domain-containing protein n=1 Tax=Rubrolithibacter danxiaensis TaxID=3390805 RepID=UPI003BF7B746
MYNHNHKNHRSGKVWVGFIMLIIGFILLIRSLGFFIPSWLISWPMLLIAWGVIIGVRHQFRHPAAYILLIIGTLFLSERVFPGLSLHEFLWPLAIIGLGLFLITGRNRSRNFMGSYCKNQEWDKRVKDENETAAADYSSPEVKQEFFSKEDFLDTVAVFGGVKKNIVSKNFRGGDVVTIMGGAELNFIQADITGTVTLEITTVMGGTKIIVPSHWKVSSEVVAILGGVEDKRQFISQPTESDKVLIIKGTSILGGIEIRSF